MEKCLPLSICLFAASKYTIFQIQQSLNRPIRVRAVRCHGNPRSMAKEPDKNYDCEMPQDTAAHVLHAIKKPLLR
ncbi:hypothetical protein CWI75_16125 [Kineobactrum sediminis]|uniref:Uncharacterized protein n=1 Tax=Kineobactrum sediminis TaxID=1905677 RepID=A0A2N5XZ25_9GAMM|nr:hypothetical protein CWI75_16125 [Kineobactrum sediminis]